MTKGKFGLSLTTIAVIAFVFTALGQPQSVLLVAGFALLAENDEWLNKQAIQALLLTVAYYLSDLAMGWVFGGLTRIFGWVKLYGAADAMGTVGSVLSDLLSIALIVFSVLAVLRVLRGKDAGLPFFAKMADGDFVAAFVPTVRAAAAYSQTVSPIQAESIQTQYASPVPFSDSIRTPPAAVQDVPAPAARLCPACSAPLHKDSRFCTECGAKLG